MPDDCVMAKRTVSVTVKMTDEDWKLIETAAERKWPDAVITKSAKVLGLARTAAKDVLAHKAPKKS